VHRRKSLSTCNDGGQQSKRVQADTTRAYPAYANLRARQHCVIATIYQDLEAKIRPTHGTSYGQGLSSAWDVARGAVDDAGEQFVLIFLSDGRVRVACMQ